MIVWNWLGMLLIVVAQQTTKPFLPSSLLVVTQPGVWNSNVDTWDIVKIVEYGATNGVVSARQEFQLPCTNAQNATNTTNATNTSACFTRNTCANTTHGSATLSWDGTTLLLVGEQAPIGPSTGFSSPRVVAEINGNSTLMSLTSFSGCLSNYNATCGISDFTHPVGIAGTGAGSNGWFINCRTGNSLLFVNRTGSITTITSSVVLTPGITITNAYNSASSNPQIFVTGSSGTQRSVFQIGSSVNTAMLPGASPNYLSGTDVSQRSGSFTDTANAVGIFFASPTQAFLCLANTIVGGNGVREITRWSASFGSWTTGRLFNMGQPCSSITGRRESGALMVYTTSCIIFSGCTNALYQINADIGTINILTTPPVGYVFSSVSLPPCDPTTNPTCPVSINGVWNINSTFLQLSPSASVTMTSSISTSAQITRTGVQSSSRTSTATASTASTASTSQASTKTTSASNTVTQSYTTSGTKSGTAIFATTVTQTATGTTSSNLSYAVSGTQNTIPATISTTPYVFQTPPIWKIYDVTILVSAQSETQIQDPMTYLYVRTNYLCSLNIIATAWIKQVRPIGSAQQPYSLARTSAVNIQPVSCLQNPTYDVRRLQVVYDVYIVMEVNASGKLPAQNVGLSETTNVYGWIFGTLSIVFLGSIFAVIASRKVGRRSVTKSVIQSKSPLHISETILHNKSENAFLRNAFKPVRIRNTRSWNVGDT